MTQRPVVVAHRGNSSILPPLTLAAVDAGWRAGADFVEIDINPTADGDAAVIHDATFDATTDATGPVADRPASALAGIDAGVRFSPVYAGQHVPTLAEVLDVLRPHPETGLVLEIKGDWPREALERVLAAVADPAFEGRMIVESFSLPTMRLARDLAPQLRRELLIDAVGEDLLGLCRELDVTGCNPDGRLLLQHPDLLAALHDGDLTVIPWTLNEPDQWALAVESGVDGIVTDRPDRLVGWLQGRGL